MKPDLDALGLAALTLSTSAATLLVPDLTLAALAHPAWSAAVSTPLLFTLIVVLRGRGRRGTSLERYVFAAFLALMPWVYVGSLLFTGGSAEWLWIELGGQLIFAALAVAGVRSSPWFLVAGIAAHGVLWDAWHYGRTPFMPDWYAVACLIIDVGWAVYAATQVQAWGARKAVSA